LKVRIGTRGSKLALWQAYYVEELLRKGGLETELVTIETKGDKVLDVSIAKIGSKGVFTEEIEEKLAIGEIDIAVHSAKDMPSTLPDGFQLVAFTEREAVFDVLISRNSQLELNKDANFRLGTSSTRRLAQLTKGYPHIQVVSVRGNLQTRIKKMDEGQCDALVLAYAGVKRMGYEDLICQRLPVDQFTPPAGQGSIAIEVHESAKKVLIDKVSILLNHPETAARVLCERAFLKKLGGGCSVPVFALAEVFGSKIHLRCGVISLDGCELIEEKLIADIQYGEQLGEMAGEKILQRGGKEILEKIKTNLN
jgi:hydroxymethylbilane synthase